MIGFKKQSIHGSNIISLILPMSGCLKMITEFNNAMTMLEGVSEAGNLVICRFMYVQLLRLLKKMTFHIQY